MSFNDLQTASQVGVKMRVLPIACRRDNYAYLIICEATGQAAILDPSEFSPVWEVIQREGVELVAILQTHHHHDHIGGNLELLQKIPDLMVYAHVFDQGRIPGQTVGLEEGDRLQIGQLQARLTHNPGHTIGAITYYFEGAAFVGDTLFGGGCGRLFEGTAEQLFHSLQKIQREVTPTTQIYFGHEYTENNLRFAQMLEPKNTAIAERLKAVQQVRQQGGWTTPTTLPLELATNPFLRCDQPVIEKALRDRSLITNSRPESVFKALRQLKDQS